MAIYVGVGDSPWGVKFDKDSNVLWKFVDNVHHDMDVERDGSIVTLTHAFRSTAEVPYIYAERNTSYVLDDYLVQLSPDGAVVKKVSILDALAKSPHHDMLRVIEDFEWDPLHANSVDVIGADFARRHSFAAAGQVLVSLRSRDAVVIVDMETEMVTWASYGPFHRQHDAVALDNGHLLLFDNRGHVGPGGPTRIIEMDPETLEIDWTFAGNESEWLYSRTRGTQQCLPNDNCLITESDGGRILEVTRAGQVVWEFRNPALCGNKQDSIGVVCGARRFAIADLDFPMSQPDVMVQERFEP